MFGIGTWLIGLLVATLASGPLEGPISSLTGIGETPARAMAFVAVLLLAEGAFVLLARSTLKPLQEAVRVTGRLRVVDKVAGVVPSVARMVVLLALIVTVLDVFGPAPGLRDAIESSRFGSALVAEVEALQPALSQVIGPGNGGVLLVTKVSADEQQRLQLPDGLELSPDADAERQMVDLVNKERASRGLGPLALDPRLVPVARAHAEEMFRLKYFGHVSPVTGSPFDRLQKAGIVYQRAGENLAYAQSVAVAHQGLMDSEGHRENILRPEFTELGVGVVNAGLYGRMFVQLFLTP